MTAAGVHTRRERDPTGTSGPGPRCTGAAGCVVAVAVAVVLAVVVGAVAWYQSQMGGTGGASVVVTVAPGSSMGTITATLVRQHVVDSSLAFVSI